MPEQVEFREKQKPKGKCDHYPCFKLIIIEYLLVKSTNTCW